MVRKFSVNVKELSKEGKFKCPNCGNKISPDDTSDETYEVLETFMNGPIVQKILIGCHCGSEISLVGFEAVVQERMHKSPSNFLLRRK